MFAKKNIYIYIYAWSNYNICLYFDACIPTVFFSVFLLSGRAAAALPRRAPGPAGPAAVLVRPRARPRPGPRESSSRNLGDSAPQSYETNVMNH